MSEAWDNDIDPPTNERWVQVVVDIRCNISGEVREYVDSLPLEPHDTDPNDFMWSEGNYSCDCNRHLFFERAGDREPEEEESLCGDSRYSIRIRNAKTGRIFYEEEDYLCSPSTSKSTASR